MKGDLNMKGDLDMMCFRDMTFCINSKCTRECGRRLTQEVITAAHKWWGSDKAPIAQADFNCDPETISGDLKCEGQ